MDVLGMNSMKNHWLGRTTLNGEGLSTYISKYILLYVIALMVIYFSNSNNLKIGFLGFQEFKILF